MDYKKNNCIKLYNDIKKDCIFKIDNHIIEVELYKNYLGISKLWYNYNNNLSSISLYWNENTNDFMYNYSKTFFTCRQYKILINKINKINNKIKNLKYIIHNKRVL